jgi:hypothetical protein
MWVGVYASPRLTGLLHCERLSIDWRPAAWNEFSVSRRERE